MLYSWEFLYGKIFVIYPWPFLYQAHYVKGGEILSSGSERERGLSPRSCAAMEASASSASASAASLATGQLLDRCYRHLESQGFGPMALATLRVEECEDIAKQLAFELNPPYSESIVEALAIWIQDARGEARPPPGDKARKLINDGQEFAARELKLQGIWTKKLVEELQASEALVLKKLQLSLDPERASELLAGSARPNTLKRYVASYRLWRICLRETKVRLPPGKSADLVDYLLARKDENCGRSVPESIMKAIRWFEIVAEFVEEDCASYGRLAWAAKDKIVEALSEGAPLTKRAPRCPTILLVKIERRILCQRAGLL